MPVTSRKEKMKQLLQKKWPHADIQLTDLSHQHQGHLGPQKNQETHFSLYIVEESLKGLSLIAQHRQVKKELSCVFEEGLHSLNIRVGK